MINNLIIIGAGPAGYTASIYASRYRINHLLIGEISGGLAASAHQICNYPSEVAISGRELMSKMHQGVVATGGKIINNKVVRIIHQADNFIITTLNKQKFTSRTILLATGTERRKLGLKEENKFLGKGLSYCATCDGMFFRGKVVAVVGGSDAANTTSLYLAKICSRVYQIYRGTKLRGEPAWIEQVEKKSKIKVIYRTNIISLVGEKSLRAVVLDHNFQSQKKLSLDGLFVEIGSLPKGGLFESLQLKVNTNGYIIVDGAQRTNVTGVWAAGDVTTGSNGFQQIITAGAEGAVAANDIFHYLHFPSFS